MNKVTTDDEYAKAIQAHLKWVKECMHPTAIPLTADKQARFIQEVFTHVHAITESEPHLRGAVIKSLEDMRVFDLEEKLKRATSLASTLMLDSVALAGFAERASCLDGSDLRGMKSLVRDLKKRDSMPSPSNS
jgi:hypothetical protein